MFISRLLSPLSPNVRTPHNPEITFRRGHAKSDFLSICGCPDGVVLGGAGFRAVRRYLGWRVCDPSLRPRAVGWRGADRSRDDAWHSPAPAVAVRRRATPRSGRHSGRCRCVGGRPHFAPVTPDALHRHPPGRPEYRELCGVRYRLPSGPCSHPTRSRGFAVGQYAVGTGQSLVWRRLAVPWQPVYRRLGGSPLQGPPRTDGTVALLPPHRTRDRRHLAGPLARDHFDPAGHRAGLPSIVCGRDR